MPVEGSSPCSSCAPVPRRTGSLRRRRPILNPLVSRRSREMNGSPLDRWFPELLADLARRKPQAPKKSVYAANPLNFEVLKKRDLPSRACAPAPCETHHEEVHCGDHDCRGVLDCGSHGKGSCKGSHKGSHKGSNKSGCKGSHKGSGKGSHKGSGKGSHKGSNKSSCKGSHKGSHKGSN